MATLIDSNILLDIAAPETKWFDWSVRKLVEVKRHGDILFNVVIASEFAYSFRSEADYVSFLAGTPMKYEPIPETVSYRAAVAHRRYRQSGGRRERTLPDFLIGAHASVGEYGILTRDPSVYRTYFPDLDIIAPDTHP
ncbi:type II toxin-antitoxin system VapC family toxin [Oricola sp.]|uniref:type II toxin-antitoxin system VapC family toxin n=1 Tax=Oricola sp. TaxID=1979950 RepID=UPI0025EB0DD2|nr:type II toxin-antitoxin system VapC family toxin [Oricola sp.]MCI5074613.1 type II toxin-antitoxin system VapC family toxin [Oricola sp.]